MNLSGFIDVLLAFMLAVIPAAGTAAAAVDMAELLPPLTCGNDWRLEGKPEFYNRETLTDRINGEAELYLPYGFDCMAAARYAPGKTSDSGMDVEIYRMGSPLDAFGMYANYRQKEGRALPFGSGSALSGSQLFLYQGRYFVHIQTTGSAAADPATLTDCGKTVTARLPATADRPPELALLDRPEIVRGSERYLPQSILGYDFLNRGLMAEAVLDGATLQLFRLLDTTSESAAAAFDSYRSQLAQARVESAGKGSIILAGVDPLYGAVLVLKRGGCLAGALKFGERKGIPALLENICR
jgi:hypothetical protein